MRTATFVGSHRTCTGTQQFFYDVAPAYVDPETHEGHSLVAICTTLDGLIYVAPGERSIKHGYMLNRQYRNLRVHENPQTVRDALIGMQIAYVRIGSHVSNIDLADYGACGYPGAIVQGQPFGYERIQHESAPRIRWVVPIAQQHRV
jgi:hypothetical protein